MRPIVRKSWERESDELLIVLTVRRDRPTEEEVIIEDAKPNNLRLVSEDFCDEKHPTPSQAGAWWGQIQLSTV